MNFSRDYPKIITVSARSSTLQISPVCAPCASLSAINGETLAFLPPQPAAGRARDRLPAIPTVAPARGQPQTTKGSEPKWPAPLALESRWPPRPEWCRQCDRTGLGLNSRPPQSCRTRVRRWLGSPWYRRAAPVQAWRFLTAAPSGLRFRPQGDVVAIGYAYHRAGESFG